MMHAENHRDMWEGNHPTADEYAGYFDVPILTAPEAFIPASRRLLTPLQQPFQHHTPWVVFTGAPLSGKTSVLDALQRRYTDEVARVFIEDELDAGRTIEEIRGDSQQFQRGLVGTKRSVEKELLEQSPVQLLDRAMPDSLSYYRLAGLDPREIQPACTIIRYGLVLHFAPLPDEIFYDVMAVDQVRTETLADRHFLDTWLQLDYQALGYSPVTIPVMPLEERVAYVRSILSEHGISIESIQPRYNSTQHLKNLRQFLSHLRHIRWRPPLRQ